MTAPIVLPCGVPLPRHPTSHPRWQRRAGDHEFIVEQVTIAGERWLAMECYVAPTGERFCRNKLGTRDECIAWLDARVRELRAALLVGAEETIADALAAGVAEAQDVESQARNHERRLRQAAAILRALAGKEDS